MNEFNLELISEKFGKAMATTETGMDVVGALFGSLLQRIQQLEAELKNLRGLNEGQNRT